MERHHPGSENQTPLETNRLSASNRARRKPLYRRFIDAVKQRMHPRPVSSKGTLSLPSGFGTLDGLYAGNEWKAGAFSLGFNAAILALLLLVKSTPIIPDVFRKPPDILIAPNLRKPIPLKPAPQTAGGGGGASAKTPDTQGALPQTSPRVFVPPSSRTVENPALPMAATIVAGPDIQINSNNLGNPLAALGAPGLGTGPGNGIGPRPGNGVGDGLDKGYNGDANRPGGGISQPVALRTVEPEYSEDARRARQQGEILLQIVVNEAGRPVNIRVLRGLGLGLDEKAKEAVSKWIFKPGMKDGKPVPVFATVAVTFRLL